MYIRTELGVILNIGNNSLNDSGLTYFDNKEKELLFIKSQGENLIDVLEELDDLYSGDEWYRIISLNVNDLIRINGYGGELFLTRENFNTNWVDLITDIITHEQYTPLKQEVK